MNTTFLANIIGYIAAAIGIVMFLPQVVQSWRTKQTKGLSFLSFSFLAISSSLWLIYGILMSAAPIILVNAVLLLSSIFILILKRKYG